MNQFLLLPIILPILAGMILLLLPEKIIKSRNQLIAIVGVLLGIGVALALMAVFSKFGDTCFVIDLVDKIPIFFAIDDMGRLFATLVCIVMSVAFIFSIGYMKHEQNEKRYYSFYLITFGVLIGLDFSGNLVTTYMFYELMTIMSVPLVLHTGTREAIMAGMKYLIFSFCGAYMALFGIYFLNRYADLTKYVEGGSLKLSLIEANGNYGFMLVVVFLMIIGFGVKSGMYPMHAWLPTAHPVAPAPASAVLSGIIVKSGILAIIRTIFYVVGPNFVRGTWVQTTWLILAMITILMGSGLAYKEKVLKKRFAYSTVSNLSYIALGIAVLNPIGLTGALLHVTFHALIKCVMFLTAGAIIVTTGKTKVKELVGIGRQMPVLMWSYTLASLALIGIPPTSGVVSKWYLALGAFDSEIPGIYWIGPLVLLISALLTAGYLLKIAVRAFTKVEEDTVQKEPEKVMLIPIVIVSIITLLLGLYPTPLIQFISGIVDGLW